MPSLRITNLPQFEAQLRAGVKSLSNHTFDELLKDAEKLFKGLPAAVERSPEYGELRDNEDLRGKLGLAKQVLKSGGDTDENDLLKILNQFKIKKVRSSGAKKFSIIFPDSTVLQNTLIHTLSRVELGTIQSGPIQSWFRWWEFGDRGEIDSLTITTGNILKLLRKRPTKSKQTLADVIQQSSRSGFGIQIAGITADTSSSISGRGLITQTYSNFLRVFPARMGKTLNRIVRQNRGSANRIFARGIIR